MITKESQLALLRTATRELLAERGEADSAVEGANWEDVWPVFRGLVNMRPPAPASPAFLHAQDELLRGLIEEAGIVDALSSPEVRTSPRDERLSLWRGDITRLKADAIVNAANSQMLGCFAPNHLCIDNAIHTFAGVQLRAECANLMAAQGHEEPTGSAKVTSAWNLPATHVIHTVGPIANGAPTASHREQLASSYRSCLNAADEHGCTSLAFCCISTGVFGYPQEEACEVALDTVHQWLDDSAHAATPLRRIVFVTFGEVDESLYRARLGIGA